MVTRCLSLTVGTSCFLIRVWQREGEWKNFSFNYEIQVCPFSLIGLTQVTKVTRRTPRTDFLRLTRRTPQKQGMAFASLKHIIVWRHGCLEKKLGFCRDGGQGEDDRSMRDLSDATGRPSVCERQRVAGGTGQGCHTGPEEKRMLDRATGCCVQLWLRTFYFEDLFKILSRMEWFGILENLRKIKMLLNFKEN